MGRRRMSRSKPHRPPVRALGRGTAASRCASGLLTAAAVSLLAFAGTAAPAQAAPQPTRPAGATAAVDAVAAGSYIVRARPGHLDEVVGLLSRRGVTLGRRIALINAVVARLPAGAAQQLRSDARIVGVTANAAVTMQASTYDPTLDVNSLYTGERNTSVRSAWGNGATGAGIDVALVDSGVRSGPLMIFPGSDRPSTGLTPESTSATSMPAPVAPFPHAERTEVFRSPV